MARLRWGTTLTHADRRRMLRCLNSSSLLKTIRLTPFAPISCPHNSYYKNYTSRRAHKYFMDLIDMEEIQNFKRQKRADAKRKERGEGKQDGSGPSSSALSAKLKGHPSQSGDVRLSKTLSWILRHGSQSQGLYMRPDGYVRVADLVSTLIGSEPLIQFHS